MTTLVGLALLGFVILFGVIDGIAWYTILVELFLAFILYSILKALIEVYFEKKIGNIEDYYNREIDLSSSPDDKKFLRRKADRASRELREKLELEKSAMTLSCLAIVISLFFFPVLTSWVLFGGIVACVIGLVYPIKNEPNDISNQVI